MALKLTIESLDQQLERWYSENLRQKTESLRTQVSDDPKQFPLDYDFTRLVIKSKKQRVLIGLALMSWYMTEEVRFVLQLQLSELGFKDIDYELGDIVFNSKAYALAWLLEQDLWSDRDFFGNVLNRELKSVWNSCGFYKIPTRKVKKYTGYCRGHRDSSRRAPSPLPRELRATSTVEEEEIRQEMRVKRTLQWIERIERRLNAA